MRLFCVLLDPDKNPRFTAYDGSSAGPEDSPGINGGLLPRPAAAVKLAGDGTQRQVRGQWPGRPCPACG